MPISSDLFHPQPFFYYYCWYPLYLAKTLHLLSSSLLQLRCFFISDVEKYILTGKPLFDQNILFTKCHFSHISVLSVPTMRLTSAQTRSLLAGFTSMLIYGSVYTYGTLIPYLTSYIYHSGDHSITTARMAFIQTVNLIVVNIGMPICNIPQLQFTNRKTTLMSIVGVSITVFLLAFGDAFWVYLLLYGVLFGLFIGFGYLAPMKNCFEHIPDRKGLCSGVCILGYGISSLLFNFLLHLLINPDNVSPIQLPDGRNIYSQDIVDKIPFAMKIMAAVYLLLGLLGVWLMKPPLQNMTSQQEKESILSSQENSEIAIKINSQQLTIRQYLTLLEQRKMGYLVLTLLTTIPFGMFMAFNYKEYGFIKIKDDAFLTVVGSCGAIFNGFGRLAWGALFDHLSFKTISLAINIIFIVCGLLVPYIVSSQYLYLVIVCLIYFAYGGNYSLYPTQTIRIFGSLIGPKIYWITFSGFTLGSLLQLMCRNLIVEEHNKEQDFKICFYIFAGLNCISLTLTLLTNYDYKEPHPKVTPHQEQK